MLIPSNFFWRTLPSSEIATSHDECPRVRPCVRHGGTEHQKQSTHLRLGLVASAATLTFELQILILLNAMEEKLPIIHFRLAPL